MIAGRVTDPTGAIVPAVTVTATADTGVTIQTRTNADGHYVLAPLVIGLYRVSIEVPGFRRAVSDVIQVHANTRARLDVQLELGAVNDTISVRSPAPLLQTDTSSLSHTDRRFADRSAADERPELFAAGDALRRSAARVRPRPTGIRFQQ